MTEQLTIAAPGIPVDMERSAVLSDCGTYRYALGRIWNPTTPPALFIGLNPSTADARQDDPTIRRCIRFARDWGYGGLLMGNLYAYRGMKTTTSTAPLKDSWLVQRLQQPRAFKIAGQAIDNPFSFGGGYKNGGLSDGAMDLIRPIMSFDYMGAAEFEFGAVPEAFGKLAKHQEELTAWSFPVTRANRGWAKEDAQECEAVVYALAPAAWREEVETRVRGWAVDPPRMQEPPNLGRALLPKEDWDRDVCGWFELDNGFLVFTDGDMWRKTAALFDVEAPGA